MKVDDANQVSAAPADVSASPPASGGSARKLKETIVLFLPPPLRQAVEKGLFQTLVWLCLAVIVLPPLIALLAAFWLIQLGKFQSPFLQHLHTEYLTVIQEGFSMEEVAARSNIRLDYLQLFDYDLQPSGKSVRKSIAIDLAEYQKATIDIKAVDYFFRGADDSSSNPDCSLPEDIDELVIVSLNGEEIAKLRVNTPRTIEIRSNTWARLLESSDDTGSMRTLEFELTEEAKRVKCGQARVTGGIRVFKDLVPRKTGAGSQ
jgi:hypothetical protein